MTGFRGFLKGVALFFGIALLAFLVVLVGMRWFIGGSSLVAPDLVGRDMVHAVDVLSRMNLRIRIAGEEHHPHLPANYVISQEPLPGTAVKEGRSISVIVSRGAEEVAVPRVEGTSQREAEITLQQNGFRVGNVARIASGTIEKGKVILQVPAPESTFNRGGSIGLLVSAGPEEQVVSMPRLEEKTVGEAEDILEKMGLKVGAIQYSPGPKNGVVTGQKPLQGTPAREGSNVDMVVMVTAKPAKKDKRNPGEKAQ